MRILLLSRYGPLGSTSRLRFYQYLPYLRSHGLEITVAPLLGDAYIRRLYAGERQPLAFLARAYFTRLKDLLRAGRFDLVWLEKEFLPWVPPFAAYLGTPYIAEYDDATFHRYDRFPNPVVRAVFGNKIATIMRRARIVIAGNDYLAAHARQAGTSRIEIVPTVIDLERYPAADEKSKTEEPFVIGWIGAPVTASYLELIKPALQHVTGPGQDTLVRTIGAAATGRSRLPYLEQVPHEVRPWTEENEVQEIQGFDIGIMPLPDEPFERGKCGYKLIQYMGCGLPVIASPVGVNREIVEHGVNGFLAETQDEWVKALETLRADPGLRRKMGAAGRDRVKNRYSLQVMAPRVLSILQNALPTRAR